MTIRYSAESSTSWSPPQINSVLQCQQFISVPLAEIQPSPLEIREVLGNRSIESLSWDKLKGSVVIIDFWATWCVPCIETIPHMNSLVEKYKDKPVVFISMTYEPNDLVLPFLIEHPIDAIRVLDIDFTTFQKYRAWAIPLVVIVDGNGVISSRIHPDYLTEEVIDQLLVGTVPDLEQAPDDQFDPEGAEEYFRSLME